MPYLIQNDAGTWCVQRKVPEGLQKAVATSLGNGKTVQKYWRKSLGTKDRREATRRAVHALAEFEGLLKTAEALIQRRDRVPTMRPSLSAAEIMRMAQHPAASFDGRSAESWGMPTDPRRTKITFGEMRASGLSGVMVYCADYRCSHLVKLNADRWHDQVRLSDIEGRFVCKSCGRRGADVRPDWQSVEAYA
jgi:hypothetical protein